MSDKDKLKEFLDKNLRKEFSKPTNEWSEIVDKVDAQQVGWFRWSFIGIGTVAAGVLAILVWNSSFKKVETTPEQQLKITELLIETQIEVEGDDDLEDYTYLALID